MDTWKYSAVRRHRNGVCRDTSEVGSQIRDTVEQMHQIGVVWGDGKASNVIIDEKENAWLIDFGGGWTDGWVDEELADSVEGDNQAVTRIMTFLGVK